MEQRDLVKHSSWTRVRLMLYILAMYYKMNSFVVLAFLISISLELKRNSINIYIYIYTYLYTPEYNLLYINLYINSFESIEIFDGRILPPKIQKKHQLGFGLHLIYIWQCRCCCIHAPQAVCKR